MTQPNRPARGSLQSAEIWAILAFAFIPVSFCFLSYLTHGLLPEKGNYGAVTHPHVFLQFVKGHAVALALGVLFAIAALFCLAQALAKGGAAGLLHFLNGRLGASVLLLSIGLCQMPIFFSGGLMDGSDPLCNINAIIEASANYRMGQWPFYTFHFSNGTTLGLQYPMMRTLWGGLFDLIDPAGANFSFEFLCAVAQLFMLAGLYRLLRVWKFSRLACVLPALTLGGCHQMLISYFAGAFAVHLSCAFAVWFFVALARWFRSSQLRDGLAAGYWLGLTVLAQPVTALFAAYFAIPLGVCVLIMRAPAQRAKFLGQSLGAILLCAGVSSAYLVSVLAFSRYNVFGADKVSAFLDKAALVSENFRWITKFIGGHSSDVVGERGEYISSVLAVTIFFGWLAWLKGRLARKQAHKQTEPCPAYYPLFSLWFFFAGALLFYGRDSHWLAVIPGIKLLIVNNRTFIFFAVGIVLLAVQPIDRLAQSRRSFFVLILGLLIFIEQAPYWLRPAYFSLPASQRFEASDLTGSNPATTSVLVIEPLAAGGCGIREDVAFHRAGFSGLSPIDDKEEPLPGLEARNFHVSMTHFDSLAEARQQIDRLKWLRVTDVVWRDDTLPGVDLSRLGAVRKVTHGVDLHLDGPTMVRGLRDASLTVAPPDVRGASQVVLPIGFSPFLHCLAVDRPGGEIPLSNQAGYTAIDSPLPVGTRLRIEAITPWWMSAVTWVSFAFTLGAGFMLLRSPRSEQPSAGSDPGVSGRA